MKLKEFKLNDYEDLVNMFYDFIVEVFAEDRDIAPKYFCYKEVMSWINNKKHIVLVGNDKETVGFSLSYIDEFNGLTNPIYTCEYAFVKPKYRKSRAAYLLYNNGSNVAKELNLNLVSNGRVENGVSNMMEKHFNLESKFINFERKA